MDDSAWTLAHIPFLVVRDVRLERSFLGHSVFLGVGSRHFEWSSCFGHGLFSRFPLDVAFIAFVSAFTSFY
jgi:hypothetical protein